jgi:hypothetical protein
MPLQMPPQGKASAPPVASVRKDHAFWRKVNGGAGFWGGFAAQNPRA